jgi:hypothetical protein
MIVDLNFNTFRQMKETSNNYSFYLETEDVIEVYISTGSSLFFRFTYQKQGTEQDLIWKQDNISDCMKAIDIKNQEVNININQ